MCWLNSSSFIFGTLSSLTFTGAATLIPIKNKSGRHKRSTNNFWTYRIPYKKTVKECCEAGTKLCEAGISYFGPGYKAPEPKLFLQYIPVFNNTVVSFEDARLNKNLFITPQGLFLTGMIQAGSVSDPNKFSCGSGSRIPKMFIWIRIRIRIQGG